MNIQDIKSADWALSTSGLGGVVEGIDDINQCIVIILSTLKGSDPLRPLFGCDVWRWVDRPLKASLPFMKRAIREAIELWEPRVIVTSVDYIFQNESGGTTGGVFSGVRFLIGWKLRKKLTTGSVEVNLGLYDAIIKAAQQDEVQTAPSMITTEGGDPITTESEAFLIA